MKRSIVKKYCFLVCLFFICGCNLQNSQQNLNQNEETNFIENADMDGELQSEEEDELIIDNQVEDVEPIEEVSEYAQVPEDLVDENGVYHPEAVTADMLRERFDEIKKIYVEEGWDEDYLVDI